MIKIYLQFKAQYLKTQMEYKANFIMMVLSGIIMRGLLMGVVFVLFYNIPDIAGWQEGEVYLILGFIILTEGLHNIFAEGIWHIPALVFRGGLDVMLSRPISPLYQIISYEIGLQGIGNIIVGVISLGLGLSSMGWVTPFSVILCIFFTFTGTVLRLSYNLISLSHAFWIHGGLMNAGFLVHSIGELAKYPVTIYPGWMRFILLIIIPAGFIGFVPALIIRGDEVLLYSMVLAIFTVLYFFAARAVFYRGVKRYESMGM
jgi:ABC-2 type transport system permease protein